MNPLKILILILSLSFTQTNFAQTEINQFDENGKRHGVWQKKFEGTDQIRYRGRFEHGKEVGLFEFYKEDSGDQPAATKLFSDSTKVVMNKFFTKKGELISMGPTFNKKREGKWVYFHNGSDQIMMIENYVDGKLHGEKIIYYDKGGIAEKSSFKNGKLHGFNTFYTQQGHLLKEFTYVNGELHGPVKYYDGEGNLYLEGTYKNNLKDGIWKHYNNGKVTKTEKYPEAFRNNK